MTNNVVRDDRSAGTDLGTDPGADLVTRLRSGERRAWNELMARYRLCLWRIARQYRLSPDDADDVVQLTWIRCLEHLDQLVSVDALGGWLATICRRESLRMATRLSRECLIAEIDDALGRSAPEWTGDPGEELARQDIYERLHQAVAELPARPRAVLTAMLSPENPGYAEMARCLGIPVGSLGPTRRRALERLRTDPRITGGNIG